MTELHAIAFDHDGVELVGQMAVPESPGAHPAVMVMHTGLGLGEMMRERVRRLAQLGYVAVATDMYGGGVDYHTDPKSGGADVKAVVSFHGLLSTSMPAASGAVHGQVAIYTGAKDPYAPAEHVKALQEEMTAAGAHFQITAFSDAYHAFTDPSADAMGRAGIAYDPIADRVSWAGTIALLEATICRRGNDPGPSLNQRVI
jgi:dienelactone hydrolase